MVLWRCNFQLFSASNPPLFLTRKASLINAKTRKTKQDFSCSWHVMRDLFRAFWNCFKVISSRHENFTNFFIFFICRNPEAFCFIFCWIEGCLQLNLRMENSEMKNKIDQNLFFQFASNSFWLALHDREQGECATVWKCQRFGWNIERRRWRQRFQRRADTLSWRSAGHRPRRQNCTQGKFVAETCTSTRPTRADKPKHSEAAGGKRSSRDERSDWGPIDSKAQHATHRRGTCRAKHPKKLVQL